MLAVSLFLLPDESSGSGENDTALPSVMAEGTLYWLQYNPEDVITAPEDSMIAGTVTSLVPYNRLPSENGKMNQEACLGQPYAFVNGAFAVYVSGPNESWYLCDPIE